jgi:hypothetical protein
VSGDPNEFLRMIGEAPVDEGTGMASGAAGGAKVAARR